MPMFVAMTDAFYGGQRLRKGEEFPAPEGFKRKWAVPKDQFVPPVNIPLQRELQNASRRKAESFVQLMADMGAKSRKEEAAQAPAVDAADPKGPGSPKRKQANSNRAADQDL